MEKLWEKIICALCIGLMSASMANAKINDTERPSYDTLLSDGIIEVRQYDPMILAEVHVQGQRKEAINQGFEILANYIFGNNDTQQKIAMTAPVQQQSSNNGWQISFVMPKGYTVETLPKPNNPEVILTDIPYQTWIVIRFSGLHTDQNVLAHEEQLKQYMEDNNIMALSPPKYAFYDSPWTLPFKRTNEVMFEVTGY